VLNTATKGIQGMQAVSNLPISAWLTAAARHGFPAVQICQRRPRALDGPRRQKNTIHESIKVSFNFIEIFRPRRDLNVQFSELYS